MAELPRQSSGEEPAFLIELPVEAVVCRVHGEVFRLGWPAGYPIFVVSAAHLVLGEDGPEELKTFVGSDASKLNGFIAEFGPLCRLLTPDQRRATYIEATKSGTWGDRAVCGWCRRWKLGASGNFNTPRGMERHHICIDCVADLECQGS